MKRFQKAFGVPVLTILLVLSDCARAHDANAQGNAPTSVTAIPVGSILNVSWDMPFYVHSQSRFVLTFRSGSTIVAQVVTDSASNVRNAALTIPAGTQGTFTVVVAVFLDANNPISGGASGPATFTIGGGGCTGPPSTPTGLTGTRVLRTANIRWNGSPGATSYVVRAGNSLGSSNLADFNVGDTIAVGGDVDTTIPLFVRVLAQNNCGLSAPTTDLPLLVTTTIGCTPDPQTMCLFDGRFIVTLNRRLPDGTTAPGLVTRRFDDGGGFRLDNSLVENIFLRIQNRCATTSRYEVGFSSSVGISDGFELFVGDTLGSISRLYQHPAGITFTSFLDPQSFATCP